MEVDSETVIAGGDTTKIFEAIEHPLDGVPTFVEIRKKAVLADAGDHGVARQSERERIASLKDVPERLIVASRHCTCCLTSLSPLPPDRAAMGTRRLMPHTERPRPGPASPSFDVEWFVSNPMGMRSPGLPRDCNQLETGESWNDRIGQGMLRTSCQGEGLAPLVDRTKSQQAPGGGIELLSKRRD